MSLCLCGKSRYTSYLSLGSKVEYSLIRVRDDTNLGGLGSGRQGKSYKAWLEREEKEWMLASPMILESRCKY